MSKLSLLEIAQSQLDKTPVIDGQLIVCLDTGNAYRDTATAHVKIGSDLEVVSDLPLAPLAEKIYYLKPDKLYAYLGGNWTLLNDKTIDLDESIAKLPAGSSTSLNDDVEIITQDTDITQPHYYRRKLVVIWEYIKTKAQDFFAAKNHKHGKADITDFPTSMPASDVYPWAKAATKPSYTKAEVGLGKVDNTADADKTVKRATTAGTADSANSVAWENVKDKPTTFPVEAHNHDDRYYTEAEINSKLSGKVDNTEAGANGLINKLSTADGVPNDATVFISQHNDGKTASYYRRPISTLWTYIKSKADGVYQPKGSYAASGHTHDDRYYTEVEIDGKLTKKLHEETITDARDLNTIKTTGVYHLKTTSYTNGPGILNHATIFVDYTVGTPYQIFIPDSVNRAWRRNHVNSNDTWSAWTELKYTDTNTWRGIQNNLTSDSTSDSLSAAQGKALKTLIDGKAASVHTHTKDQVGLGNVDNTADANKSVKYATSAGNASKVNNHTVNIDVPADAKFTDTNTWRGIQNNLTSDSTDQSLSAAQGKALKALVDGKAPTSHKHTKSQITDFPSSMPASDVYAWAKAATKPSYTKAEVGLGNVDNTADKDKSVKHAASATNATNTQYLNNDSQYMRFHWNGQSGQPTWLWGGNDASNMYVYNPSNFSVNYANSAGTTLDAPYTITYEGTYTGTGEYTGSASLPIRHTLSKSYDLVYFIKNLKGRYTPGLIDLFSQGNYGKQYVAMNMLPTTFTLIIDLSPNRITMYNGGSNTSTSGKWANMNYIRRNGNSIEFYSTYSSNNADYFFNDKYTSYYIFGFNLNHSLFHYDV